MLAFLLGLLLMAAPTNISAATAIDLGSLPVTYAQRVDDAGVTYTVWVSFTPTATGMVSVFAHGPLSGYTATTRGFEGAAGDERVSGAAVDDATDVPMQFYVTAGTVYVLRITPNGGNPSPANLEISIEQLANAHAPALSLVVPDDTDGLPAAVLDAATGEALRFEPFPAGEQADTLDDGTILTEDNGGLGGIVALYRIAGGVLSFVQNITVFSGLSGNATKVSSNQSGTFYVGMAGLGPQHAQVKKLDAAGAILTTWGPFTGAGMIAFAVSPDETIVYVVGQLTADVTIKRWSVAGAAFLSDLGTDPASSGATKGMVCLADGTVIQGYISAGPSRVSVRALAPDGTLLWTTVVLSGETDGDFRLARVPSDASRVVGWLHKDDDTSEFVTLDTSDGTIIGTVPDVPQFEGGVSLAPASLSPVRYGHSFSCPFFLLPLVLRADGSGPAGLCLNSPPSAACIGDDHQASAGTVDAFTGPSAAGAWASSFDINTLRIGLDHEDVLP